MRRVRGGDIGLVCGPDDDVGDDLSPDETQHLVPSHELSAVVYVHKGLVWAVGCAQSGEEVHWRAYHGNGKAATTAHRGVDDGQTEGGGDRSGDRAGTERLRSGYSS